MELGKGKPAPVLN